MYYQILKSNNINNFNNSNKLIFNKNRIFKSRKIINSKCLNRIINLITLFLNSKIV